MTAIKRNRKPWQHQPDRDRRLQGRAWKKLRDRWLRANPLCVHCTAKGRVTPATTLDHIVPRSKGGTEDELNLQGLCAPCHKIKSAKDRGFRPPQRFNAEGQLEW